jgi:DNA-binding MarR family transcriptional regulator
MDMRQIRMSESALAPAIEQAWINLVRAEEAVVAEVEAEVKAAGLPPLAWYDVLLELSRPSSEAGIRQNELERRLLFRQYNLSRLIDRLEEAKYVERKQCPEDGRGQVVAATPAGRKFQKQMWPVYRDAVARRVASKLTNKEAAELGRLLEKLVGSPKATD